MSRLYPTLEDMKVDQMAQAQAAPPVAAPSYYGAAPHAPSAIGWNIATNHIQEGHDLHQSLYPTLGQYMGMDLSTYQVTLNLNKQRYCTYILSLILYFHLCLPHVKRPRVC